MTPESGVLHLIPVTLGAVNAPAALPRTTLSVIAALDYFLVENEKSARAFLAAVGHPLPLRQIALERFDKSGTPDRAELLLRPLLAGRSAGLLSEAGCPAVADPGALLVAAAHRHRLRIVPHVGPSSIVLALMASGFSGQRFCFRGYLPVPAETCRAEIRKIESESRICDVTQIFIETPYRNDALLTALTDACHEATRLCVASDLTMATETVRSAPVAQWRAEKIAIGRRPSVFLLYAR